MEVLRRSKVVMRAFSGGLILGVFLVYGMLMLDKFGYLDLAIDRVFAAYNTIEPNGDVSVAATQNSCSGATNASCIDGDTSSSSAPTSDGSLTFANGDIDYYDMTTLGSVSQVNSIDVEVYHQDGANEAVYVSLWDAATQSTQYGTEVQLPFRSTAQWDPATFSGTNFPLTQGELNGLSVRLRCDRPGGGKANDCTVTAMFAAVSYDQQVDVTVGTTSATQKNIAVGTTSAYIGGAFTLTENTGSRNIRSITLTETGTVDAQTHLDNIELWYDIDNDATPDCASESFNGDEIQFGLTDTDGFSSANGTSTFSTTTGPQISTTATMCVYVVLDVSTGASFGQTVEIEIDKPSAGDITADVATTFEPTSSVVLPDTTTLLDDNLSLTRYHWRDDNGDQTDNALLGADSLTGGVENTPINSATKGNNHRLRMEVANTGNATSSATQYRVEFGTKVTDCSALSEAAWTDVASTTDDWDMINSVFISDGNTTNITTAGKGALTDDDTTFVGTGALRETTSLSGSISLASDEFTELEYSMVASNSISDGTTYCFRVTDNGTPLPSYATYPEITFNADVTVSAEESQVSTISVPTDNVYVGSFVFSSTTGVSPTIDSITITASSTGDDITTDFNDVELWWEYDTTAPANCVGLTYDGGETQYGSTDTNGFDATGTSTFTQTLLPPSVTASRAICLYVVLDVGASADNGDLLDIGITDPSVDVVTSAGTVAPTSLVDLTGITTMTMPYVQQGNYHWRTNTGTELTAPSATNGNENTVLDDLAINTTARVRFDVSNTGGESTGSYQYRLEWAQKISSCAAATGWVDVDTASDAFAMVASQLVDNADTNNIATSTGGVSNLAGTFDGTNGGQKESSSQTNGLVLAADNFAELEYSIQATANANEGASYCFRVTNAGTPLDNYVTHAELNIKPATDFLILHGTTTIQNGATTATLTEGNEYDLRLNDATRAFMRITNTSNTGAGPASTGNHNAQDVTAYISNPANIATNTVFTRAGSTGDTFIAWEVIEYVGASGGENEIVVRQHGVQTYGTTATTTTTATVSGILDDADVLPWITGQGNPDTGRFDYNTGLSTSVWNAGSDTATFSRGEAGNDAVNVSYAIVEFVGANWIIQRVSHTYSGTPGNPESQGITAVNSTARAFFHAQKRVGSGLDTHANFGHEVYFSGMGTLQFLLDGNAGTPASHTSVVWIIESTQTTGKTMKVWESNGSITAGTPPIIRNKAIGTTLDDISIASLFVHNRANGTGRTYQEPIMGAYMLNSSTTDYQLWVGDPSDTINYRSFVVEWPTANAKLYQNYFRFYVDNDALTPTDPWPAGPENIGENFEMTAQDGPMASGDNIRIRMSINVTAASLPAGVDAFQLEYAAKPDAAACSTVGESNWYEVGDSSSTTALWRAHDGTPVDGTTLSSTTLSVSDEFGSYEENNDSALVPNATIVGNDIEYDWNVENNGAADKTSYCFRMMYADGSTITGHNIYPVVRTVGFEPQVWDWRWYDDETSLTPVTDLAGTNTAPTNIDHDEILKLRTVVSEISGAAGTDVKFKLQFSESSDFTGDVFDVAASSTCTLNATSTNYLWCYDDGAGVDNAIIDDNVLATADACTAGSGNGCGTHNESTSTTTATFDQPALSNTEYEFTLRNDGARVNAVYYFRLYDVQNDAAVAASSSFPSVHVGSSTLVFTLSGVASGTVAEGVESDVDTTPTSIPFGSVPFDTEYEAIYQFNVNTNATEGYQLLMFARQNFLNVYGEEIPLIAGTNASPVGWTTGCSGLGNGCFGYHSGDDTLSGVSPARFAANDSYAAISSTTPEEIGYSPVPTNDTINMVFKLQVNDQQPAGDYQTEIVYLAIPVY